MIAVTTRPSPWHWQPPSQRTPAVSWPSCKSAVRHAASSRRSTHVGDVDTQGLEHTHTPKTAGDVDAYGPGHCGILFETILVEQPDAGTKNAMSNTSSWSPSNAERVTACPRPRQPLPRVWHAACVWLAVYNWYKYTQACWW
jgi:hypothetical protein